MRERDETTLPAGLVAVSGYAAYRAAFPTETPAWEQLDQADWERWLRAASIVLAMPPELDGVAFSDAAGVIWAASKDGDFRRAFVNRDGWRCVLHGERIAWEAATRHMVALADSGLPDGELEEAEQSWGPWARRHRPTTLVEVLA